MLIDPVLQYIQMYECRVVQLFVSTFIQFKLTLITRGLHVCMLSMYIIYPEFLLVTYAGIADFTTDIQMYQSKDSAITRVPVCAFYSLITTDNIYNI